MSKETREKELKHLQGRRIETVRRLTDDEAGALGWNWADAYRERLVIELDDGTLVLPMADPEGNGPGYLEVRIGDGGEEEEETETRTLYLGVALDSGERVLASVDLKVAGASVEVSSPARAERLVRNGEEWGTPGHRVRVTARLDGLVLGADDELIPQ